MKRPLHLRLERLLLPLFTMAFLLLFSTDNFAQVSGTVYQDLPVNGTVLNTYGVKDANELGVEGVTVTAYPGATSTTTAANGTYSLATGAGDFRIEFTWPTKTWLQSSPDASMRNTSVQFVTAAATNVNFGLHNPNDFSDTNDPFLVVNRLENGDAAGNTDPALYSLRYTESGNFGAGVTPAWNETIDAVWEDLGATWGMAYQKAPKKLFVAPILRRHTGLANGLGTIYVFDYNTSPATTLANFDLQGVSGIDFGTIDRATDANYTLPAGDALGSVDFDAFGKVGKVGVGDIDITEDGKTLWLVNLNQKSLISVDISGAIPGAVSQTLISTMPNLPSCTGGEIRPWAIKFYEGKGYLGCVCDAESSQDRTNLEAFVLSFDPNNLAAGFTQEVNFPLDYERTTDVALQPAYRFYPWMNTWDETKPAIFGNNYYYPQAILSDIEFAADGSMFIGFFDRWGHQTGFLNRKAILNDVSIIRGHGLGEMLKACRVGGAWVLEGDPGCAVLQSVGDAIGVNNNGEFFEDKGGDDIEEMSLGAFAVLQGSSHLISAFNDPYPGGAGDPQYYHNDGLTWYDLSTGLIDQYVQTDPTFNGTQMIGDGLAKTNGVGDVELLTAAAPIEIGNLIWNDTNSNGIQDPSESGIAGVEVKLFKSDGVTLIGTAMTDANGNYIFSNAPTGPVAGSHIYQIAMLMAGQDYIVRIENASGGSQQAAIGVGNELILASAGEGANGGLNNTDGVANTTNANATVTATAIPITGANNHSFDFGFGPCISTRCGTVSTVKN